MFDGVMANGFGSSDQNYCPLQPYKEHAGKDDVHPYRQALL